MSSRLAGKPCAVRYTATNGETFLKPERFHGPESNIVGTVFEFRMAKNFCFIGM